MFTFVNAGLPLPTKRVLKPALSARDYELYRHEAQQRDEWIGGFALENHLQRLGGSGKTIVTYCRCPGDSTSMTAARRLDTYGIEGVKVLDGGYDAWVAAGGALESSAPADAAEPRSEAGTEPQ